MTAIHNDPGIEAQRVKALRERKRRARRNRMRDNVRKHLAHAATYAKPPYLLRGSTTRSTRRYRLHAAHMKLFAARRANGYYA